VLRRDLKGPCPGRVLLKEEEEEPWIPEGLEEWLQD
jgi:hypothetical protein